MKNVFILLLLLTYSQHVISDNLSDSNKLFNWAEEHYSQYFNPPGEDTFELDKYLVRYYKSTDIYIGTLGKDVYVYGETFNGLMHVGSIEDFIDLPDTTSEMLGKIKVVGNNEFITQTEASLEILKNLVPIAFEKIQKYIGTIEQGEFSHMWAFESPPRYEVSDRDSFYSIKWYAGAIAHETKHSELYQAYQAKYGLPVPDSVWSSDKAEKICIDYQIDIMKKINAPQFDIDFLIQSEGNCDVNC